MIGGAGAALLGALLLLAPGPAKAEAPRALDGVALVIGNGDYESLADLPNPENDARAVEELLDGLGFDTSASTDRDSRRLRRDLERFVEDASEADVAVLYYSGHGIEAGGENFLVPVDADLAALDDAGERLVPLSAVLAELKRSVPVAIVMLDACRDNPFPPGATLRLEPDATPAPVTAAGLGETRGAAPLSAPAPTGADGSLATVIGFAAEPGKVALDGAPGGTSPYAAALVKHLGAGAASFSDIMTMVTEEVYLETGARQRPWVNASFRRLLFFGERVEEDGGDEASLRGARRHLLLSIATTPRETRGLVETLARADDLPLDQLYGMLGELDVDTAAGPDQLEAQLRSGAENLKRFIAERVRPVRTDPELVRLSGLADRAQDEGAIGLAKEFRAKASARADRLSDTLDSREDELKADRLQLAATYAEEAETAVLAFDYRTAAARYADAYRQAEKWDGELAARYRLGEADALSDLGEIAGDNEALLRAIELYRAGLAAPPALYADPWRLQNHLGIALLVLGDRDTDTARLREAVAAFREALKLRPREEAPREWAKIQNNLGNALRALGLRESGASRLDAAVAAYRAALEALPREAVPDDWATVQENLGSALSAIGTWESGSEKLEQAIAAYRAALEVRTREASPFRWASLQNNLAGALSELGSRERGAERLEEAVALYRGALEEYRRDRAPMRWATTQRNLAVTLVTLGGRESGTARLEEAAAAFRAVSELWTRERVPLDWATVQNGLGNALLAIGEREEDTARIEEAIAAFRAALSERTRERGPLQWAETQNNLGSALAALGKREQDVSTLEAAAVATRLALQGYTREGTPTSWADAQFNLGLVMQLLALLGDRPELRREAVTAFRASLEVYDRDREPLDWAVAQNALGEALSGLGHGSDGTAADLEAAAEAFRGAVDAFPRDAYPADWSSAQHNLAFVLTTLAIFEKGTARLEEAVAAYREALAVRRQGGILVSRVLTQNGLGSALVELGRRTGSRARVEEGRALLVEARADMTKAGQLDMEPLFAMLLEMADAALASTK